jgi:GST-like protein
MIDVYYWTTPNGHKMAMFFEETGLEHRFIPVNLQKNEQSEPAYLKIAPNGKIPAIIDLDPAGGGEPVPLFESGAILLYLAEKSGMILPKNTLARAKALQWLFWQVSGLSPMAGQQVFFRRTSQQIPFAIDRYTKETTRLFSVLNGALADGKFLAGEEYSIADISAYPWVAPYNLLNQDMDQFPHLERWLDEIAARPATKRAYQVAQEINPDVPLPPAPRGLFATPGPDSDQYCQTPW